ncbi:MAG TPA: hypothetical protein VJX10_06040 [Pseudonocardiaceae bacterium]|nr:hypothetical protein [Pseudonocardiaceae bacterium]
MRPNLPDHGVALAVRAYRRIVFLWLANWWDGVDLWLSQLAFPFQFAIVIAVLAPVCLGLTWLIERVVDLVSGRVTRSRTAQHPPAERVQTPPLVRADVPAGTPATIITTTTTGLTEQAAPQVEAGATAGHGADPAGS